MAPCICLFFFPPISGTMDCPMFSSPIDPRRAVHFSLSSAFSLGWSGNFQASNVQRQKLKPLTVLTKIDFSMNNDHSLILLHIYLFLNFLLEVSTTFRTYFNYDHVLLGRIVAVSLLSPCPLLFPCLRFISLSLSLPHLFLYQAKWISMPLRGVHFLKKSDQSSQ